MTLPAERGTSIGRLRVRVAARDATAVRMRSESLLRTVDLQPAWLPSQAILCIRSLPDPLPGTFDLGGRASVPPLSWQHAARESIERLARRAVRPALEFVPAAADAVLFLDRAEVLACAARDLVRGMLAREWWWPRLVDVHAGLAPIVREWLQEARSVPAAMALLARRRDEIVAVAQAIARDDARRIVEAVLREHALPSLAQAIVAALTTTEREVVVPRRARIARPRWVEVVPEVDEPSLLIEQRLLLAATLLLQRAPAIVRARSFETAIVRWIAMEREEAADRPMTIATMREKPASRRRWQVGTQSREAEAVIETRRRQAILRTSRAPGTEPMARMTSGASGAMIEVPSALAPVDAETPSVQPGERRRSELLLEVDFDSDFAGALFLFNVGIALGFYSDFTSPAQQGIGLDIFLFVDRLARALTGKKFARDPMHAFLKRPAPRWTHSRVLAAYPNAPRRDAWITAIANHLRLRHGSGLARQLVSLPGRITASPLHLDAHFSLALHPIEIRIAGLDRNPGWIPAAGRHVAFHFD
jgi:hypothetical protein